MFDKKLAVTAGAIAAIVTAAVFVVGQPQPLPEKAGLNREITIDPAHEGDDAENPDAQEGFYLREYNGHLAVFLPGSEEPEMELNVFFQALPDYDKILLREGIYAKDYSALSALIEDYTS